MVAKVIDISKQKNININKPGILRTGEAWETFAFKMC